MSQAELDRGGSSGAGGLPIGSKAIEDAGISLFTLRIAGIDPNPENSKQ